jgi:predicted RNA-binding protein YlxR (DUF448 family)
MSESGKDQERPCIKCGEVSAESSLILLRRPLSEQEQELVDPTGSNAYSAWVHRRCLRAYQLAVQRLEFRDLQSSLKEESGRADEGC